MNDATRMETLRRWIDEAGRVVFFGGAGTSTESQIPDFRSSTGLYHTLSNQAYPPEVILSHSFFYQHPNEFYDFYKTQLIHRHAKPNRAHAALAELERRGKLTSVITQNIDGLHQMAGSEKVLELHGSVYRNACVQCGARYVLDDIMDSPELVPQCRVCEGLIKPDVVLYEENLDLELMEEAVMDISHADLLIVGGTSLTVQPAAGMIRYYRGSRLVLINQSETSYDRYAGLVFREPIGQVLSRAVWGEGIDP